MLSPRRQSTHPVKTAALVCACLLVAGSRGGASARVRPVRQTPAPQSEETARGVALYRQGDFAGAVESLKKAGEQNAEDADAWHFLGLAYRQKGDEKKARKALERAVLLRLSQLSPRYLRVVNKDFPTPSEEARAAMRAAQAELFRATLETLEAYIELKPRDADFWRGQVESLRYYSARVNGPEGEDDFRAPGDVTQRAVILSKPNPRYTEEARRNRTGGQIALRLVLAPDGTVQHILVTRPLPDGLTETAVEAAKRITFRPAMKDGRPVAQVVTVMYGYSIY